MQVRDDEDLAVTQLPAQPAPGRADDPELRDSARTATAEPEQAAERAQPPSAPAPERARLAALRDELAGLAAQRARLPLCELRQLDTLGTEIAQVGAQRADVAERLAALPAPERRLLGRDRDPHAAERARLVAAVSAADQQLIALTGHRERLTRAAGPLEEVRSERGGLDRRIAELEREGRELRDQLAEREVAEPPAWARETFGERPARGSPAVQWDRGVREIARYRIEHDVPDHTPGLGPAPDHNRARAAWRQAARAVTQIQRRLGRDVDRGRDRGAGLEL